MELTEPKTTKIVPNLQDVAHSRPATIASTSACNFLKHLIQWPAHQICIEDWAGNLILRSTLVDPLKLLNENIFSTTMLALWSMNPPPLHHRWGLLLDPQCFPS